MPLRRLGAPTDGSLIQGHIHVKGNHRAACLLSHLQDNPTLYFRKLDLDEQSPGELWHCPPDAQGMMQFAELLP